MANAPQPKMTYAQYKRRLALRNLAFNFRQNTQAIANKAAPVLKQVAANIGENAGTMLGAEETKPRAKKHAVPKKEEAEDDALGKWAKAWA